MQRTFPSQFRDVKLVVPSPGVAALRSSAISARRQSAVAFRKPGMAPALSGKPVLGVTGTNGKTTTTSARPC